MSETNGQHPSETAGPMPSQPVQVAELTVGAIKQVGIKIGPQNHATNLIWHTGPAREIAEAILKVCDQIDHGLTVVRNPKQT